MKVKPGARDLGTQVTEAELPAKYILQKEVKWCARNHNSVSRLGSSVHRACNSKLGQMFMYLC